MKRKFKGNKNEKEPAKVESGSDYESDEVNLLKQ